VSNGGKFKLYTVLNGLIFPTPTQPRISFERAIVFVARTWKRPFRKDSSIIPSKERGERFSGNPFF
jgi:hypothetical protein